MAWTASQLCAYACNRAKCPGFTAKAGDHLNAILQELALTYDFDVNRETYSFNFVADNGAGSGSGPYNLPTDFLRMEEGEAGPEIFFTILGVPYPLAFRDRSEFDRLVMTAGLENYPSIFTLDLSSVPSLGYGQLYVWMPASGAYPVTLRYFCMPADIPSPATSSVVPWFPVTTYLQNKLTARMCEEVNDDDRAARFDEKADVILEKYLPQANVNSVATHTVKLDPRRFGKSWDRLPNTKAVGF
jgi:hypothetical protein